MHAAADRIRNVALIGHRGSGKTSLHEALLFEAGAINRLGSVPDKSTVSDSDSDEQARQMSISATLSSFQWQERKINLLDTPGDPSFVADALGALRVCESAVFVVNAVMGVEVTTTRLWARAAELDIARLLFVNMLDRERADFFRTLEQLKRSFGQHVVATEIPIGVEHDLQGVIDLVDMKAFRQDSAERGGWSEIPIPEESAALAEEYREKLMDEVSEVSDALMERYLEGEEISHEEIVGALKEGTNHGRIFPVVCGVATRNLGTTRLLDAIVEDLPSPVKHGSLQVGEVELRPSEEDRLFAYVFKTRADPFAGRINLLRVYQGVLKADSHVLNTRAHVKERIGQLVSFNGKEISHESEFGPGDIGAVAKLKETRAGDWLADRDEPIEMPRPKLPAPVMAFAVAPKSRGDEEKVLASLRRLQEEDPTIDLHRDQQTGEQIVAGPLPGARRSDRRPPARPLRRGGHAQAAPRALPRDDPRHGRRARPPQEAIRRPRPVRRLPDRDRAADRQRRAGRLRVRRRDQGRRDPELVHPRRREGRARGDGIGRRSPATPSRACGCASYDGALPLRGLLRDRLQARRHPGDEAGPRAGRPGAARADHARHAVGSRG